MYKLETGKGEVGIAFILIAIDESNDEILDYMMKMKSLRESQTGVKIVCAIGDFDDDNRELWDVNDPPKRECDDERLSNLLYEDEGTGDA